VDLLLFVLRVIALGFVAWGGLLALVARLPKVRRRRASGTRARRPVA
jgi:hypothetical protein